MKRLLVIMLVIILSVYICACRKNDEGIIDETVSSSVTDSDIISEKTDSLVQKEEHSDSVGHSTTTVEIGDDSLDLNLSVDDQNEFDNGGTQTDTSSPTTGRNPVTDIGSFVETDKTHSTSPTEEDVNDGGISSTQSFRELKWDEFYSLSSAEKDAYLDSFASNDEFFDWMMKAQSQFKEEHPDIEIGPDGSIDLSKLG